MEPINPFEGIDKIQVELGNPTYEWKFDKMVMDKDGIHTVQMRVANFYEDIKNSYRIGFALNPDSYNVAIRDAIRKFLDVQSELPVDGEGSYVGKVMKLHGDYNKESKMFGTYEFDVLTTEHKNKMGHKVIKFVLDSAGAEFFRMHFGQLARSVIVFNEIKKKD